MAFFFYGFVFSARDIRSYTFTVPDTLRTYPRAFVVYIKSAGYPIICPVSPLVEKSWMLFSAKVVQTIQHLLNAYFLPSPPDVPSAANLSHLCNIWLISWPSADEGPMESFNMGPRWAVRPHDPFNAVPPICSFLCISHARHRRAPEVYVTHSPLSGQKHLYGAQGQVLEDEEKEPGTTDAWFSLMRLLCGACGILDRTALDEPHFVLDSNTSCASSGWKLWRKMLLTMGAQAEVRVAFVLFAPRAWSSRVVLLGTNS